MTYDELDDLVDTDPLRLRDEAWALLRENERLRAEVEQLAVDALDRDCQERGEGTEACWACEGRGSSVHTYGPNCGATP